MKKGCCRRVGDKWTPTNIPYDSDIELSIYRSSCCAVPLIYYDIEGDYFYDENRKVIITKEGIDHIKALYKIISSDEFIYQRKEEE